MDPAILEALISRLGAASRSDDWLWAVYEPAMQRRLASNLEKASPSQLADRSTERRGQIGVLRIEGVLTKHPIYLDETSTPRLTAQMTELAGDDTVLGILMIGDSPGGSTAALAQLYDAVIAAARKKPVWGQTTGMCASACYSVMVPAERLYAQRMDLVGSIGTRMLIYDWSKFFADAGVEAVAIDTGPFKSLGALGTEITQEQRDYLQRFVDQFQDGFTKGVRKGRKLTAKEYSAVADGRIFLADEAAQLGLIDGVQSLDKTIADFEKHLTANTPSPSHTKRRAMSERESSTAPTAELLSTEPKAATLSELRADRDLEGASAEFLLSQLERGATLDQARRAWDREQLAAERKAREEAEAKAAEAEKKAAEAEEKSAKSQRGVKPLGEGSADAEAFDGDAAEEFLSKVNTLVEKGMPRRKACSQVNRKHPELREAMVAAANA